jgi:prepilin-type N-terminal cleavage/methylation domain-containing protein
MKQKAFTLIELLVVIAIIGVIASIVLVNMRGSREKARIAKGMQFSHSIYHRFGAYAIGIWSFDDSVTDASTSDVSGYGNHCDIVGATAPNVAKGIIRNALEFDGSDDSINCGRNGVLNLTDAITIEAWVYPYSYPGWSRIVSKEADGTNDAGPFALERVAVGLELRVWREGDSDEQTAARASENPPEGKWTHVVATWDGSVGKIYFDAAQSGTDLLLSGTLAHFPLSDLRIGNSPTGGRQWHGRIDEVRIYSEVLTIGEIKKHYVEGLENRKLVEK